MNVDKAYYEVSILTASEATDKAFDKVTDAIESLGISIEKFENLGTKSLSYSISGHTKATYANLYAYMDAEQVKLFGRKLNNIDEVLRYLCVLY